MFLENKLYHRLLLTRLSSFSSARSHSHQILVSDLNLILVYTVDLYMQCTAVYKMVWTGLKKRILHATIYRTSNILAVVDFSNVFAIQNVENLEIIKTIAESNFTKFW